MRYKQYYMTCEVCGGKYIATRKGSHYCSNKCRAHASNMRKAKDGSRPKTVYVPTGRPRGRPRKDLASTQILVQEKTRSEYVKEYEKEVTNLVRKTMHLPPHAILESFSENDSPEVTAAKLIKDYERKKKDRENAER